MTVKFSVEGSIDPLLHAHLSEGDTLFCESGAMVAMDECLYLVGKARGGVLSAIGRKMLNDESFFQQKIEARRQGGEVLLSPTLQGDVKVLDIGVQSYAISDGCYLANTEGVTVSTGTQGLGKALFARTGSGLKGFFILHARGRGQLCVSGFGSLRVLAVTPEKPILIDNGHLVAWDESLDYEVAMNTAHKGLMGTMVESVVSGEGIVLRFKGQGNVIVCSRNRQEFSTWVARNLPKEYQPV